jgi:hypothetical protein
VLKDETFLMHCSKYDPYSITSSARTDQRRRDFVAQGLWLP